MNQAEKAKIGAKIAEAAKQSGVEKSPSVLTNWRKGRCLPTLEKFLQICTHSNLLDFNDLLKIAQNNYRNSENSY